jgi:putative ABC transport system permease protein
MLRATLKSLLSRKTRLVLAGLAVILGVMFVSGAFVLTDTLSRSFGQLFTSVYANTAVEVSAVPPLPADVGGGAPTTATVPASLVDTVRAIPGVTEATGQVATDGARLIGANGKVVASVGPPRVGGSWTSQAPTALMRQGRAPAADSEIAINAALATAAGVHVGDQVGVLTPTSPKQTFTLVGIFGYAAGADSLGGAQVVAFTEPVAQQLMLGQTGVYTAVDVKGTTGLSDEALRDRISAALGSGYQVRTGKQLSDEATAAFTKALTFFNYVLLGFAAVALFVGTFLILNTFSIIVAQRTRELALMRALGASRGQIIGSVLTEASLIGLISSVLGLGLGIGVGALLARLFSSFTSGNLALAGIGVPATAIISAFAVGIGITIIAALIPALRAARIAPVAAMRDAATPDRPMTKLAVAGGVILAIGAGLLGLGLSGNAGGQTLSTILGGVLLAFVGVSLLTPLLARPVAGVVGRLFSWSVPGRLGRLNSGRNPRRTAITAAALMVGIALITGINTVITSAKQSISKAADSQAHVDLIISGEPGPGGAPTFDPAVLDATAALDGVRAVSGLYADVARVDGARTSVGALTNMAAVPGMFTLHAASGVIDSIGDGQIVVDEKTATAKGLRLGSVVTVQLPKGAPLHLTVSGIYAKSDLVNGYMLPISAVTNFRSAMPTQGFIQVKPGASVATVKARVDTLLKDSPEVNVGDRNEYLAQQTARTDTTLTMISILLALAILIAVLGVINTLALSVLERTRELGLLRAVGLGRAQTMWMVTVEAVVISLFGALLGLGVGIGLGAAVVRALKDQGLTVLALPWSQLGTYLVLAAIVGVVAAVLPAIRAARTNVLQAIAYE